MKLACVLLAAFSDTLQPAAAAFSGSSSARGSLRRSRGVNSTAPGKDVATAPVSGKHVEALTAFAALDHEMVPPVLAQHAACLADDGKYGPDDGGGDGEKRTGKCYRNPKVWGPPTWFFLHAMTLALPEQVPQEKRNAIENLMNALPLLLPCPPCGANLGEKLKDMPVKDHLFTRDDMVQYMIDLHNRVNKATGKPILTKEEVLKEYDAAFKRDGDVKYMAVLAPEEAEKPEKPERSHAARRYGAALSAVACSAGLLASLID